MILVFSGYAFGKTDRAVVGIGAMQDTGFVHREAVMRRLHLWGCSGTE